MASQPVMFGVGPGHRSAGGFGLRAGRSILVVAVSLLGPLVACSKGKQNAAGASSAANFGAGNIGDFTGKNFTPGKALADTIKFAIKDKSGSPIPAVKVDFKVFDISALPKLTDDKTILTVLSDNWDTSYPVIYADLTTTQCKDKSGACTPAELAAEKARAGEANRSIWLGLLGGQSDTSDATGVVWTSYTAPRIFSRSVAVAMRVQSASVAADLVQFVRIDTANIKQYLAQGDGTLVNAVLTSVPSPILAGSTFDLLLEADIPDTGTDTVAFAFSAANVPGASFTGSKLPSGTLQCSFLNGQCLIPGGPYKVMAPGEFQVTMTPSAETKIIKPITNQTIKVIRGPAAKLVISSTPPDKAITPLCANPADLTRNCLALSADSDAVVVYPALLDEGGNFVGTAPTTWTILGPLAGRDDNDTVAFEQTLKPLTTGAGTITVTTGAVSASFTYQVSPGTPASLTIASQHATATSAVENATVPFTAALSVFDKKNNLCTNWSGAMPLNFSAANAGPSVPPAGSGWAATNPVTTFAETVSFTNGVGASVNTYTLALVPGPGQPQPQLSVSGGVQATPAQSRAISVQPGPTTQSLLRSSAGGGGSPWTGLISIAPNLQYFFAVAGYDAAGNYTADQFSRFYGVTATSGALFDLTTNLPGFLTLDPTLYNNASTTCPGATTPASNPLIACPVHLSLTVKSGVSTVFAGAGFPGTGQILAVPQTFDTNGNLKVAPALSGLVSINSGVATSLSYIILDKATGNPVPLNGSLQPQVTAGQLFNIKLQALDANNIAAVSYTGPKTLSVVSRSNASWGGALPVIPNGTITCTFLTGGVCTLAGDFQLTDTASNSIINVQDITVAPAVQVPKLWTTLVAVVPGPESQTYVVSKKGGPTAGGTILTTPVALDADHELALAAAVTDNFGNWIRDMAAAEPVWDGTADIATGPVPNPTNTWVRSDIFASLTTPITASSALKFLPLTDPTIYVPADRVAASFDIVYQPADRVGTGYILVKSGANAALVANPSPLFTVSPGQLDHAEFADPAVPTSVEPVGLCFSPTIKLHDKKHNIITDYTTVTQIGLKMFVRGATDPSPGIAGMAGLANSAPNGDNLYTPTNTGTYPTLHRAAFDALAMPINAGPRPGNSVDVDPWNNRLVRTSYEDYVLLNTSVVAGQIATPPNICLFDSQTAGTAYADREIQVELAPFTNGLGKSFPALTSRGPGTLGSTATLHSHPDYFRVNRGTPDHVHMTLVDSQSNPSWVGYGNGITWGLDSSCPVGWVCGPQTFYAHKHDRGCNYLGFASPTGATLTGFLPAAQVTTAAPGPLGSAAFRIAPALMPPGPKLFYVGPTIEFTFNNSEVAAFTQPQAPYLREGSFDGIYLVPGAPKTIAVAPYGNPPLSIDSPFGLNLILQDQFGNPTGSSSSVADPADKYQAPRTLSLTWDASNGPASDVPVLGGPYAVVSSSGFDGTFLTAPTDFQLYLAQQTVTVHATLTDNSSTPWYGTPQTYLKTFTLLPTAGVPTTFQILDAPATNGNPVTGPVGLSASAKKTLYACTKDAKGNIQSCTLGVNWVEQADTPASGAAARPVVSFNASAQTTATAAQVDAFGLASGTAQVKATISSPIAATATTGTITVAPGLVVNLLSTYPATINAGVGFNVTLTAVDSEGNVVTAFTGSPKTMQITASGDLPTKEALSALFTAGSQPVTFTNGVATIPVTVFASGSNGFVLNATYAGDALTAGAVVAAPPLLPVVVVPGALHHYVTTLGHSYGAPFHKAAAKAAPDNNYADIDGTGSRFDVIIEGRDQWGNDLDFTGAAAKTLSLALRHSDATTAAPAPLCFDNTSACLAAITLNTANGTVTKSMMASKFGGDYYFWATDGTIPTKAASSNLATFTTSHLTVASYSVTPSSSSAVAGNTLAVTVTALDAAGQVVTGADSDLSSGLAFTWVDGAGNPILGAPNGSATATLPPTFAFSTGSANPLVTLVRAQALKLQVKDNQTPTGTGTSPGLVTVSPSTQLAYDIAATTYPGGIAIADDTHLAADATGRFTMTVTAYDNYKNPKNGESGIVLVGQSVGNALNPANLQNVGSHVPNGYNGIIVNLSGGVDTLPNVYYQAAHHVKFILTGTTGTLLGQPQLYFDPSIGTVAGYTMTATTSTYAAGQDAPITVNAIDYGSNIVTGIDSALNAQTYTFSGAGVSPAPSSLPMTDLATSLPPVLAGAFGNGSPSGVATKTLLFHKAEYINSFIVQDNLGKSNGGAGGVALTITPALPYQYVLTPTTTQPVAGAPFSATVAVVDQFSNAENGWTTDSLTWGWTGAHKVTNSKTSALSQPVLPPNGATAFSSGLANFSNALTLVNSLDTPTLTLTGSRSGAGVTASGAVLSASVPMTPKISPTWSYAYITNGTSCNGNQVGSDGTGDCGAGSVRQTSTASFTVDQTRQYYGHGFDPVGNYKGPAAVTWSASAPLNATVSPASGSSSTTLSPVSPGTGTVSLDCSGLTGGCTGDTTGTITTNTGTQHFDITYSTTAVTAGTPITVTVKIKDTLNNVVNYTGTYPVVISLPGNAGTAEGNLATFPTGTGPDLAFSGGVATFSSTIYSVGAVGLAFQVSLASPSIFGTGPAIVSVTRGALHHYATVASHLYSGTTAQAKSNLTADSSYADVQTGGVYGSRFDVTFYARDQWGNNVDMSATPKAVTLSLMKGDGSTPADSPLKCQDNTQNCLTQTFNQSGGSFSLAQFGYDLGGTYYVWIADGGGIKAATAASTLITEATSRYTVKQYAFTTVPTNATAGTAFVVNVAATDNFGRTITGADSDLSAMSYAWFDGGGSALATAHLAPSGATPTVNGGAAATSTLAFASGTASVTLDLFNAESGLVLKLTDNQTAAKSGTAGSGVTVGYSPTLKYKITSTAANGGTFNADQSAVQTLTVAAYDPYLNPRPGESNATLQVVRASGTLSPWILEGTSNTVDTPNRGLSFNALSTTASIANAFYRVGQTVTYNVVNTAGTLVSAPTHTFQTTIDSIASYGVSHSTSVTVGDSNLAVTVTPKDPAGNPISTTAGIDTALSGQVFAWTPVHNSPVSSNTPPVLPTALTFSSSVATPTLGLYNAENPALTLTLTDNHAFTANTVTIGNRSGASASPVLVAPGAATKYLLSAGTTTPQAGVAFDVTVTAHDQYDNNAVGLAADTLTFAWSGASNSVSNPYNTGAGLAPTVLGGPTSRAFSNGVFTTTGTPFVLYRANEAATLTVTGALTKTLGFTAQPAAATAYVLIADNSTCSAGLGYVCGGGTNVLSGPLTLTIGGAPENMYAQGFDAFGNYKAMTAVTWAATGELNGKLSTTSGSLTTLTPTVPTTTARVVTAACAGCVTYTTGGITANPGTITQLVFIAPSLAPSFTVDTEACSQLTIQTQDVDTNPRTVGSNTGINLTAAGGNGDFFASSAECVSAQALGNAGAVNGATYTSFATTSTLSGSLGSRTVTLPASASSVSVWYANRTFTTVGGATLTAASGSWTNAALTGTVNVGGTKRMTITTASISQNAVGSTGSTCSAIAYTFQDKWANAANLSALSAVTWSSASATGAFYSNPACSTLVTSGNRSVASGAAGDTVYYADTKANTSVLTLASSNLSGNAALNSPSPTLTATVAAGPFAVTGLAASGAKVPSPVNIQWSASAGAKNYTLSYGTTTACTTAYPSNPVTGTSVASLALGADALYYFCVVANPYSGAATTAASTNASYALTVDSTLPTATAFTQGLTGSYVGPNTTATHSVDGSHTTFKGVANDNLSGVASVSVQVQRLSDSQYLQGAGSWGASATWLAATGYTVGATATTWSYSVADADLATGGDGVQYTVTEQIVDQAGNTANAAAATTVTWKSALPTSTTITGAPSFSGAYSKATALTGTSFSGVSPGPRPATILNYLYVVVSGTSAACPTTKAGYTQTSTGTAADALGSDGQYTLCVIAQDTALNVQAPASPSTYTWYKETVTPTVSVTSTNPVSVNSAVTPTVSAGNAGGQPGSTLSYAWSTFSSSGNCTAVYSPGQTVAQPSVSATGCSGSSAPQGTLSLRLTVTNSGGTSSTAATYTVNWDTTAATVTNVSTTKGAGSYGAGTLIPVTLTFNKSLTVSGTPQLTLNSGAVVNYTSGSGSTQLLFNYTVGASDNTAAGNLNVNNASALALNAGTLTDAYGTGNAASLTLPTAALTSASVIVDTAAPTLVFSGGLPTAAGSQTTVLNVAIQTLDANRDTNSYKYAVVSGTSALCPGATYSASWIPQATNITDNISGLADGNVTICAIGMDKASNAQLVASATSYTWKKDVTPPTTPVITPPGIVYSLTPTINWSASTDATSGMASYTLKVSNASDVSATCTSAFQTVTGISNAATSQALSALPSDGGYALCLTAIDVAGNTAASSRQTFSVETDKIQVSYTTQSGATYGVNYASWNNGSWAVPTSVKSVNGGATLGRSSLTLDGAGVPWIAYSYFDGASTNQLLYNNGSATAWAHELAALSNASGVVVGQVPSLALDSNSHVVIVGQDRTGTVDAVWAKINASALDIDPSLTAVGQVNDTEAVEGTNNNQAAFVYSVYNGTHWVLNYATSSTLLDQTQYEVVPVDGACTDTMKVSAFIKPTATAGQDALGIAYTCVTAGAVCKVYYQERSYASIGSNGTPTGGAWQATTLLGTAVASSCTTTTLSGEGGRPYRPSLVIDRQNSKYAHVAWYDGSTIRSSSNEASGAWNTEAAATSVSGGISGEPSIGVDVAGHSYILYANNSSLYMVNNNSRSAAVTSGAWVASGPIDTSILSVGSLGISGMMGRSNNAGK